MESLSVFEGSVLCYILLKQLFQRDKGVFWGTFGGAISHKQIYGSLLSLSKTKIELKNLR